MLSGYFYIIITKEVRMSFRGRLGYCEDFTINIWHCCFIRQEKGQMSMAHRERIQLNINRQTVCVCVCELLSLPVGSTCWTFDLEVFMVPQRHSEGCGVSLSCPVVFDSLLD